MNELKAIQKNRLEKLIKNSEVDAGEIKIDVNDSSFKEFVMEKSMLVMITAIGFFMELLVKRIKFLKCNDVKLSCEV